jgi:hypothetical protein
MFSQMILDGSSFMWRFWRDQAKILKKDYTNRAGCGVYVKKP